MPIEDEKHLIEAAGLDVRRGTRPEGTVSKVRDSPAGQPFRSVPVNTFLLH